MQMQAHSRHLQDVRSALVAHLPSGSRHVCKCNRLLPQENSPHHVQPTKTQTSPSEIKVSQDYLTTLYYRTHDESHLLQTFYLSSFSSFLKAVRTFIHYNR